MGFSRSITSLYVASPVCLATLVFGCNKEDSSAAWEDALDASEEGDKTTAKDSGKDDDDEDETSTSTGTRPTSATASSTSASSVPTAGNSSATSPQDSDPVDAGTPTSDESDDETADSTEVPSSSASVNADAAVDTTAGEQTSDNAGCDGYLLCETFEDVDVGAIPDGWQLRGENVAVATDNPHGGARALKIDAANAGPRQIIRDASVLGSAHWGRVFYRVDLPVPDGFVHSTIVALSGEATESGASEFRLVNMNKQGADTPNVGSKHNWAYNVQVTGGGEWVCESGYDREFDADWHCSEYFVDANTQTVQIYSDGDEVTFTSGADDGQCSRTELPQAFDELRVGWNYYAAAPPGFTVYIDDIAFDDERIGCE